MGDEGGRSRAMNLLVKILDNPRSPVIKVNPARWDEQVDILAAALRQVERETWEKAAKEFDRKMFATDKRLDNTRDYRVDEFYAYCRQQAKARA